MIIERFFKIMLVFFLGLFCLAVGINNIMDYQINFKFLQHVVAMDTMQPWFDMTIAKNRAITNLTTQKFLYHCIIAVELLAGLLALYACFNMLRYIKNDTRFSKAKNIYIVATGLMMCVWYFGFNVIASNWFYMWANQYNALPTAYNFIIFMLVSMIYVARTEKIIQT